MLRKAEDGDVVRKNRGWLVWCIRKALRLRHHRIPVPQYIGEAVAAFLPMLKYIDASKGRLTSYTRRHIVRRVVRSSHLERCVVTFPEYVPGMRANQEHYNRARRGYDSIYEVFWDGRRKRSLYRELPAPEPEEDDSWEEHRVNAAVDLLLARLTDREREIVIMRFGLYGMRQRTLLEVAKIYGISRERVRQLEARAMAKMQLDRKHVYKSVTGKEW